MSRQLDPGTCRARVDRLCACRPDRRVGGPGNRAATDYFAEEAARCGLEVRRRDFDCLDWEDGPVRLSVNGQSFSALASPYSRGCEIRARLEEASTMAELEQANAQGAILLIRGELAREQLMPKNFVFYNPEEHRRIVSRLERLKPAALVAATGRNPQLAGGMYPFPLFEDGDFEIPSVYLKDTEGEKLAALTGQEAVLHSGAQRKPSSACQVIATRPGDAPGRIVACAHIDAKAGSPGALDNATGVAALLGLAELLQDYSHGPSIELVPFNGEDYYAAPGQMLYLRDNEGRFDDIQLAINLDGVACAGHPTAVSLYECNAKIEASVKVVLGRQQGMIMGESWPQGDHSIFAMQGRPALAITSGNFMELCSNITHTPKDRPELVDPDKIAGAAEFMFALISRFGKDRKEQP